jgi:peptide/nickel transport system substrate-binding protein
MRSKREALALLLGLLLFACSQGTVDTTAGSGGAATTSGGAAGTQATSPPAESADITIVIAGEPTTLDPQIRDDGNERAVSDNVYETLMARSPDGQLEPGLAASEPTQIDETTWQFTLREGISFHNGEPFNAESVVASVERIIDPDFASEQVSFFSTISGAEAVDDLTVNILTSEPDPILPARMYWMKMVPTAASAEADFAENPSGTGPYRFVEWVRGDHVTLEANPDYWGETGNVSTVTYRFVPEAGTRLSALIAGDADVITNLQPEDIGSAPKSASVTGLEHPVLIINAMEGPTADVRVRQAMNLAVDKQAMADELFGGNATVDQCQILSESFFGYNPELEAYAYDPDQARTLISEAGAEGATVELIGTAGRWLKDREVVEVVGNFLTDVGLTPNVQIFEFDEYLNRLFGDIRPPAIYVTSSNELLDADRQLSAYYHLDGIGASNDDAELAGWIDEARSETDVGARESLYHQAVQKACDEAYFLFMLNINDVYGMSERLQWQPRVDAKLLVREMTVSA